MSALRFTALLTELAEPSAPKGLSQSTDITVSLRVPALGCLLCQAPLLCLGNEARARRAWAPRSVPSLGLERVPSGGVTGFDDLGHCGHWGTAGGLDGRAARGRLRCRCVSRE